MTIDPKRDDGGLLSSGRAALPYPRRLIDLLALLLTLGGIFWAFDVYNRVGLAIYDQQYLAGMLAITLVMAFLKLPMFGKVKTSLPWYDLILAVAAFGATAYMATYYPRIVDLVYLRQTDSVIVSVTLIVLLIEALLASRASTSSCIDWWGGSEMSSQPSTRPAMRGRPICSK